MKVLYYIVRISISTPDIAEPDILVSVDWSLDFETLDSVLWRTDVSMRFGIEIALFDAIDVVLVTDQLHPKIGTTAEYNYYIRRAFFTEENATELGTRH